jgi:hypothetical protein
VASCNYYPSWKVICPNCHWCDNLDKARKEPDGIVCCPHCDRPVERLGYYIREGEYERKKMDQGQTNRRP